MNVTSYLALYTTILGWQQYQNLWSIVVGTGLIYLPFLGIVLKSTVSTFTSMGAKPASQIALRRMFIGILGALFVIGFAATPVVHVDPKILHFEPWCQPHAKIATPGDTGTTYDEAFDNVYSVPTGIKIPIFWYLVMAFSNGFTHAANVGLSCSPIDYRVLHNQLNLSKIQDPQLKKEVGRFYNECYIPSYDTFMSGNLSDTQKGQIDQYIKQYGKEDTGWLGSQVFIKVPGFYNANKAQAPVEGFLFDPQRDTEEGQIQDHSKWGSPSCVDWWQDASSGLRGKLLKVFPVSFTDQLMHIGAKADELKDASIKTLIAHSFAPSNDDRSRGYESLNDYRSGTFFSHYVGATIGVGLHSMKFFPKLYLLIDALPLIQGSLLFAVYAFLALAIPFSSYRMSFCVMGAVVIFSLIFCSFIWHVVAWFDHFIIQALYPDLYGVPGMGGVLNDNAVGNSPINATFANMIVGLLYVVLPLVWMTVMTWAGFRIGGFLEGSFGHMGSPAEQAGGEAGGVGGTAARMSVGKFTGGK